MGVEHAEQAQSWRPENEEYLNIADIAPIQFD